MAKNAKKNGKKNAKKNDKVREGAHPANAPGYPDYRVSPGPAPGPR